ncbi:MAG: InlB B-repeat-containing protein, partial [Atopobiaceae bacterium]|nr:InlB B-repeat-containing protein [Atopobiaceae bacterium]
MKQHSIRAHLLLAMVTVLVALMCLPAAAFGAQQVITDSQGRRYDSFDAALANVPNDGSVSLTLSNTSNKSSALSIKIDRPINVSVSTPQDQKTASKVGSIQMTAGTLTLNAGRFWTQNDKTSDFEKTSNLVVADVVSLTNAQMQASGVSFENLMRVYDTSQLTLTSCMASDPEIRNAYRADKNATIMLLGKVVASVDACYIDGDMNIGSGCKLTKLNETDLINTSKQRGTALYVSRGATVDEIVNSTIYGSSKALFFTSAGSATLENCVVISDAGNPIDAGKDSSDWKGCRVEKSLEDSNRGVGRGAYYGSDREFDNTWFKGIVPEGYRLSRWTKQVEIADVSTIDCRYLVRTDCTLTYDANGGTGDMSSSNKKNQWGDRFQTVAKCTFTRQGASFMSWNTKEDGTGFEFKPGDRLSFETQKDIVLYAQWTTKMCTLVFDTQGGTPVASQTVVPGNTFKRPEDPTREGYTLGGWYKDAACTQEYDFATPASELSLTIYAKWLPDCTLVCNSMGGSQVDGVTVKYGQKVWEPATPKRPHYRFKGWYEDEQCTHLVDFPVTLTHKMTVYAKWDDYLDCHAWDEGVISKEATCNTYGTRTYTCTIDPSHTRTEPIPKKAHRWTSGFEPYHWTRDYRDRDTYYKDSTCDKAGRGMLAVYCQDCDFIIQRTWTSIPALGHDWGRWTPIEGTNEEQRVCSRNASHTETRTVRPESCRHGHLEHVLAKEPSCTEPGNNEYWACPDCHEWYLDETCTTAVSTVDEVQIPALSHELDDDSYDVITETEATCEAAGIETWVYRCTRCHQPISSVVQPIEPLGHDWGPWVPVEGTNEQERVCTRDASHTQRRETPTETCLHQDVLQIDAQNATCTRAGNKKYWVCTTCQEWFSDADCTQPIESADQVILPALGHKPGEAARENEVAPSCEHPGSYDEVVRCTVCGDVLSSKSVVVPATGHTPGDAVNTNVVEATCEHAGTHDEVVTCTTCGMTLSHNIVQDSGPLGHEPGETERMNEVAPTCTDAGSYDEVTFCARCNKEFKRETVSIAPLDHDWGAWVLDDEGIAEVRICQRDARHMQTRTVTPESCTHENKVYVPGEKPTCTSEGSLAYWACPDCHEWYLDEDCTQPVTSSVIIERLAHTPGEEVHESEVPASCTEAGSYVSVVHCTVCSEELSRQIVTVPATGHTAGAVVKTNVVEATCEHAGTHDELVSCTSCNEVLSRKTVEDMPALGHKAGEATREEVRPATCEQEGFCDEVVCCTVCDEELSRQSVVIPATGHTAGAAVKAHVVEATCEHAGTHDEVVSCTVCDQELSRKTVEDAKPLGHVPSKAERENVVDPDCEFDGSHDEVVRCERCGDYLSWSWELDAATGHQWGAWQTIKEPTAYDEGLAKRVCAHNDAHIEYRSIPTLEHEHSLEHVEAKPASCVSEGNNEYWRCEDCDACFLDAEGTRPVESDADIVVARLAHTPDKAKQGDVAEATCEEDGCHDEDAYCKACGTLLSSKTVIDQALGHDWGNWETVEPASSTTAGLARRVCKRDSSHKQTMVVPALHNHTLVFVEQMDASCQAQGVRAHWRCTNENCGALFANSEGTKPVSADELAIPQCEHTPSDKKQKEQGRAATCSEEGISYEVSYCANCGEQIARNTITVSRVAHQQGELVHENVVDPTCSKRGTQDEVACCANCGTELWRRMVSIPCSDHTPGEAKIVNVVNPTETEPGS